MSREYFTMLGMYNQPNKATRKRREKKKGVFILFVGTLSSTELGLGIMTRNRLFDHLKPMSELPQREDLCHLIMTSLDYNMYESPFSLPPILAYCKLAVPVNRELF